MFVSDYLTKTKIKCITQTKTIVALIVAHPIQNVEVTETMDIFVLIAILNLKPQMFNQK
jgi:hypothetical protein